MSKAVTASDAEVLLAQPRGFCAGVDRAIDIVERAIELHGAPIYVRHEIVHNRYVVEDPVSYTHLTLPTILLV